MIKTVQLVVNDTAQENKIDQRKYACNVTTYLDSQLTLGGKKSLLPIVLTCIRYRGIHSIYTVIMSRNDTFADNDLMAKK